MTDCNSAACRLFGGAKEWLVGRAMTACFTPGLELPVSSEDGQRGAVRATCLRVDGSRFQAEITSRNTTVCGAPVSMIYVHEIE